MRAFKAGDTVLHKPSGETWMVASVGPDSDFVACAGWPETIAPFRDLELVKSCSDEESEKMLREAAKPIEMPSTRRRWAKDALLKIDGCSHPEFHADVAVNRLEDTGRFSADVKIRCAECGVKMRFIGLPAGVDLNGAAVSADATEARLAIAPLGEVVPALEGGTPVGFSVRRSVHNK